MYVAGGITGVHKFESKNRHVHKQVFASKMTKILFNTHLVLGPRFVHNKGIIIQLKDKYKLYAEFEKIHKRFFMVLQEHLKNVGFRVF